MTQSKKNDLTSLLTHQLREPLTNIKWALSLLLHGEAGELSPEQKELITKAFQSNEHSLALIDDMLKADRIDSDSFDLYPVDSDIFEITQKAFEEMRPQAEKKKIQYEFKGDHKTTPLVAVDVEHVTEAILNLLQNAICYTKDGGSVTTEIKGLDGNLIISVKDTGIGIPEEDVPNICNRFFRAKNSRSINLHGSGLGLFIVKRVIERHGGKVWFDTKEGVGSTFFISLPLKAEN